ncbi:MAG: hypothetical protein AAGG65_19865 [Pseudomonadota bacterium]
MRRALALTAKWLGFGLLIVVLTGLTQIGGLILVLAWLATRIWRRRSGRLIATIVLFCVTYAVVSVWIVPPLAAAGGRQALPCTLQDDAPVRPQSLLYCILNRHYASPRVAEMLDALAADLSQSYPGIQVAYLDASFPFFDGFPLPPHLSHDDGRKIDLPLYYRDDPGPPSAVATPSPIGYFGFEQPRPGDPQPCAGRNDLITLRWDFDWIQGLLPTRSLDEGATALLVRWFVVNAEAYGVERVLLEPHLQRRLGVEAEQVRFQGCRAARHDDHIHVQIRP